MTIDDVLKIGSHIEIKSFDENSFLLINNDTGKYLKINENFHRVINLIDSEKSIKEILFEYNQKNTKQISKENGILILKKLNEVGLFSISDNKPKKKKLPDYIPFGFIFFPKNGVAKIVPFLKFLLHKKQLF